MCKYATMKVYDERASNARFIRLILQFNPGDEPCVNVVWDVY